MKITSTKIRSLKVSLALFACLFFLMGCGVQENFDYLSKEDQVYFPWDKVVADLEGSERVGFFKVTRGSPYSFWCHVVFDKREHLEGTVQLTEVKVINARINKFLYELDSPVEEPIEKVYKYIWVGADGDPPFTDIKELVPNMHDVRFNVHGVLRFKDQASEYDDLILRMNFIIKEGGNASEYNAEMQLEKRYSKQFSSIFD